MRWSPTAVGAFTMMITDYITSPSSATQLSAAVAQLTCIFR
jgi:hypothetical protein